MPLKKKLKDFLDDNQIRYVTMIHSSSYTAQEMAETIHIPGQEIAKTVVLKEKEKFYLAVVTANHKVDLEAFKKLVSITDVELPTEKEFMSLFPLCEVGAMPPFGNLYDLPVYVDQALAEDEYIYFNACSLSEVIKMKYSDYQRLVQPTIGKFGQHI